MNVTKKTINKKSIRNSLIIIGILICVFIAIVSYRTIRIYQKDLPSFERLHNIEPSLKTKIYSADGTLLQEYFNENRVLIPYDQIPKQMVDMLLAVEDRDFFNHWGLNPRRLLIVSLKNLAHMNIEAGGASTITQQLARMLFLTRDKTLERKFKEALTAIKLERTYSKEEIIQMYLNQYYFHRAYGISAAARAFFDKNVDELTINDCAILLGMLRGPTINSPFNNPDKSLTARNRILYAYYSNSGITKEQYDSLRSEPLHISPPVEQLGKAPYFTEEIRKYIQDKYGDEVLYSGGLKVVTTLDWKLQQAAEAAVKERLDSIQARIERTYGLDNPFYTIVIPDTTDSMSDSTRIYKQIQGAVVSIDNATGNVLAMVGGKSFEMTKFNRATQSLLQPGSSFKPFVYTAAMDNGFNPSDLFYDNSIKLEIPGTKDWRPHNFDNKFLGEMTLRDGLKLSRNLVAIKLLLRIKPEQAIFYAHKMGITTPLRPVASLAIGTEVVHLIEMVSAFTVFPNGGIKVPYRLISRIYDRYGNVIEDNTIAQKEEVLSAQTAYIMVNMMQSVIESGTGRGVRWRGFTRPAGGKTGTSDNFCDNWFIGYTPQITTGVWVGFDDKTSIGRNQTGSTNALPIWTGIMKAAHDSLPIMDFEVPEGIEFVDICLESGKLATDRCVNVRREVFRTESVPQETCPLHPSKGLYVGPGTEENNFLNPEDTSDIYNF
nr:PBP1A family penicillin-binding protein [candidate division Zixibacteria bacterium]